MLTHYYKSRILQPQRSCQLLPVSPLNGFTVVEIFVAIMVIMISLSVALQMFISAVYLRSRSQEFGDAYQWVQEDFENVRQQAVSFESAALPYSPYCGAIPANSLAARFITNVLGGSSVSMGPRTLGGEEVDRKSVV